MTRLKHVVIAAAGVLALVGLVTMADPQRASAQLPPSLTPVPVKVTNTPLPVTTQGTMAVSGAVQAQQSGAWSVGLNPGTTVSATVSGGGVSIVNPATDPVLVRDVNGSREPFQFIGGAPFLSSVAVATDLGVPAGKRLVVEHLSAQFMLPADELITTAFVSAAMVRGGVLSSGLHFLRPTRLATLQGAPATSVFAADDQTRLYIDGGSPSFFRAERSPAGEPGSVLFSISGYLVPPE